MSAIIEVKWNGKKLPVEFQNIRELETTSVKDFKLYIQRLTGIDPSSMRLQAFGAIMNNDDMPLSVYGLRPGSYITMKVIKSHDHGNHKQENVKQKQQKQDKPPPLPSKSSEHHKKNTHHHKLHNTKEESDEQSNEEAKLIEELEVVQTKVENEVTPQVKKYEKDVKEFLNKSEKIDKDKKKQVYMGAYLGEQLMHVLFELDSFTCGPNNLNARQKRKEIVKVAQALLDKVDDIKTVVKNVKVVDEEQQ